MFEGTLDGLFEIIFAVVYRQKFNSVKYLILFDVRNRDLFGFYLQKRVVALYDIDFHPFGVVNLDAHSAASGVNVFFYAELDARQIIFFHVYLPIQDNRPTASSF